MQSHIIYGIQIWGNGNTKKLEILQKRAVRIINNSGYNLYKSHTDPILKSENTENCRYGSFRVRSTNGLRVTPPISMKFGTRAGNA